MFSHRTRLDPVELAFTDRHGGVSRVPFESLNLNHTGDDAPDARRRNLQLVLTAFAGRDDAPVADLDQVHGDTVVTVDGPGRHRGDGLVTDTPGLVLLVRAADCVPVLLADPAAGVVGAAHAGRGGVLAGVVPRTVEAMRSRGAEEIVAWVGPHVCGACYEVPADLREEVAAEVPATHATTSWGTPSLDLGAGVRAQLAQAGVGEVHAAGACTRESPDLFSYRREGPRSGRLAGLVRVGDRARD